MATIQVSNTGSLEFFWVGDLFSQMSTALTAGATTKSATVNLVDNTPDDGLDVTGWKFVFAGTGFTYANGDPLAGDIANITLKNNLGDTVIQWTGVTHDLGDFWYIFDGRGFTDGYNAYQFLFNGDDVYRSGPGGFDVGLLGGNDTYTGGNRDEYVEPGAGNDSLNGGGGFDTLSYEDALFDPSAFRGIVLDAAAGTVADPWGNTDAFSNFEAFHGTQFRDIMRGSDGDNSFRSFRGNDLIDGRDGFDVVDYSREDRKGGFQGIVANLTTGTITDTFGTKDTVSNVEEVRGSRFNDTMTGGALDDSFAGLDGADRLNGLAGFDMVRYDRDVSRGGDAAVFVRLQTSISGGVIIGSATNGFGKTDVLRNVESVRGTDAAAGDTLFGSNVTNRFEARGGDDTVSGLAADDFIIGEEGADRLTGGAGSDHFEYWLRTHGGDTITDFTGGQDRLGFESANFGGVAAITAANYVQNLAGNATTAAQRFILETDTGELYFDLNGSATGGKTLVAILTGVASLTAAEFDFF